MTGTAIGRLQDEFTGDPVWIKDRYDPENRSAPRGRRRRGPSFAAVVAVALMISDVAGRAG